jgi:hypothetical protein
MNETATTSSPAAMFSSKRQAIAGLALPLSLFAWIFSSLFVHALPHGASDRAGAALLKGANVPPSVAGAFVHACVNCHSDETRWPWYSHVAPASWLLEHDVKRAREHMDFSHWSDLEPLDQRVLLTAIATVIENHEMPPHRYTVLHPEANLSSEDRIRVIEWTRAERHRLRAVANSAPAK